MSCRDAYYPLFKIISVNNTTIMQGSLRQVVLEPLAAKESVLLDGLQLSILFARSMASLLALRHLEMFVIDDFSSKEEVF